MKNIALFCIALLTLLVYSCSKKDEEVVYPVTGGPIVVAPVSGTGSLTIDQTLNNTSSISAVGNTLEIVSGDKKVNITFFDNTFADGLYTTNTTASTASEVKIEVVYSTGETYVVEAGKSLNITTSQYPQTTTNVTIVGLEESTATSSDVNLSPIKISFSIVK